MQPARDFVGALLTLDYTERLGGEVIAPAGAAGGSKGDGSGGKNAAATKRATASPQPVSTVSDGLDDDEDDEPVGVTPCVRSKASDVMEHAFFSFSASYFDDLLAKRLTPPFSPQPLTKPTSFGQRNPLDRRFDDDDDEPGARWHPTKGEQVDFASFAKAWAVPWRRRLGEDVTFDFLTELPPAEQAAQQGTTKLQRRMDGTSTPPGSQPSSPSKLDRPTGLSERSSRSTSSERSSMSERSAGPSQLYMTAAANDVLRASGAALDAARSTTEVIWQAMCHRIPSSRLSLYTLSPPPFLHAAIYPRFASSEQSSRPPPPGTSPSHPRRAGATRADGLGRRHGLSHPRAAPVLRARGGKCEQRDHGRNHARSHGQRRRQGERRGRHGHPGNGRQQQPR